MHKNEVLLGKVLYAGGILNYDKRIFMKLKFTSADSREVIHEERVPLSGGEIKGVKERQIQLIHRVGEANLHQVYLEDIHYSYGRVKLNEDLKVKVETETPLIEMHFSLSGSSDTTCSETGGKFVFAARQHNLFFMPAFDGSFYSAGQKEANETFEIHFTESYFRRFEELGNDVLGKFYKNMERNRMIAINGGNMRITAEMNRLIGEIAQCRKSGDIRRLFVEAKILELLSLQLEQCQAGLTFRKRPLIKTGDIEKLHYIKALLDRDSGSAYSITGLAKEAGLNDFKLKAGFRQLFGNTVFGYLHEIRMQKAIELLSEKDIQLHEIASFCGYAHVQHFITAFKKKFGVTPGYYRGHVRMLSPN